MAANVHQFSVIWKWFRSDPHADDPSREEAKTFQRYLSKQQQTGFFTDLPPGDGRSGPEFILMQYELLPNILTQTSKTEYAVAHLHDAAETAAFLAREHFQIVRSYPNGLALLKRTD
ncbi:MAG TPA: hypothetical protein VH351_19925 [Bryobacteraceae bacterium]|nr:hypothetical protein [Bryobacteraceae bacterium]